MKKTKKFISIILALCLLMTFQQVNTRYAFAALNALDEALNASGSSLSFVNDSGHPWLVDSGTDPGRTSAVSNISNISNGSTTLTLNAGTLAKNKVLEFEWKVISEYDHDLLYFIANGTPYANISGQSGVWKTFKYVVPSAGSYTFTWVYSKDGAVNGGVDRGWVDNVRILDYVAADSIAVSPLTSPVYISFTTQLNATVYPENATFKDVTWSSDNETVATVNSSGVVTGVTQGQAHIIATTVKDGGITGEAIVNVLPPVATTGISLNYTSGTLLVGDSGTLVATIYPALASYRTISWYTSSSAIATVTTAGVVTAKAEGTAVITAQTQTGGFYAQCTINVITGTSLQDQTHLAYTPVNVGSTTPVSLGWHISEYILYSRPPLVTATTAFGYSVYLEAGKKISFKTGGTSIVDTYLDLYDSSFNRLAYDDDEGEASYSFIDTYFVPYTGIYYVLVSGYSTSSKGDFNFYIEEIPPVPVTGVAFNSETFTVPLNHTLPLSYSVLPGNADYQGVTFTSSNENSITVTASGEVTGVSPGSSVVTVTTAQGGFTDTCLVSVGYTAVTGVSYDTDAVIIGLNKTKTLQYTIEPSGAQLRGVAFASSNLSVATVSTTGVVTAVGLGNAVITVTTADCGKTDTCSVKVVAVNISSCASLTFIVGDVWGDGTGYQFLLDADADAYGRLFQKTGGLNMSGNVPDSVYNQFEIKIPSNANGVLTTANMLLNSSSTILIPAGTYDYCITNPVPADRVWIASTTASSPGRYNNFNFEAGYSYTFVISNNGLPGTLKRDVTTLTSSYTGAGLSKYSVGYSVSGTGGTLGGKTQILVEEGYTLTAADLPTPLPNPGYYFLAWNAVPVGTTVNAPISFTATFAILTFTVIFKDWDNSVRKTQLNVPYGTAATPPASPNTKPNYHFIGWSPDYSFITGNLTVTAQYAIDSYAVNLPTGLGFTAAPEGASSSPVNRGGNFTFRVTLTPNYSKSTIVVKSNGTVITPAQGVYSINNITEIKNVTVEGAVLNPAVYTALDAAISLVPAYADSYYTTATINVFRNAVTAGLAISRSLNVLSQPLIDDATELIVDAYTALVLKPAVYTALDAAQALIPAYNDVYYSDATIVAFRNAVAAGQAISRLLDISQQAIVNNAASAINTDYANLVLKPDPTLLVVRSSSSLAINRSNNTVNGFSLRANSAANIIAQFENKEIITITDANGVQLNPADLTGTGCVIKLLNKDGVAVDQITAIVYGDTDGNGLADSRDAAIVSLIVSGMLTQANAGDLVYSAADANRDGSVSATDVLLLHQAGLFLVEIS